MVVDGLDQNGLAFCAVFSSCVALRTSPSVSCVVLPDRCAAYNCILHQIISSFAACHHQGLGCRYRHLYSSLLCHPGGTRAPKLTKSCSSAFLL
jgi:hypothetical protein